MKLRRRSLITREGWYYLFILGFVVVGSLLRHINLLVGLSAILSSAMILNWRMTRAALRQVDFTRRPLPPVWCNRPTTFEVEVENNRRYLTSFSLMVSQRFRPKQVQIHERPPTNWLTRLVHFFRGNSVSNYVLLDCVHVGQTRVAEQVLEFRDRGEYEMGPLTVSTHYPLGLTRREISDMQPQPLFVGPALGTLSYGWVDRMLGLGWQDAAGGTTSRSGEEFFSLRPWLKGDSRRWVHWRATARHGTLLVRQFQRSQSKAFSLIVDLSLPSNDGSDLQRKQHVSDLELLLRIVATISNSVRDGHADTARITLVADEIRRISFPCGEEQWQEWHRFLATVSPVEDADRLFQAFLDEKSELGLDGLAGQPPAIVMSLRSIDDYAREIVERSGLSSSNVSADQDNQAAQEVADTTDDGNSGSHPSGNVATLQAPARTLQQSEQARLWNAQRQIRTWLTPGDTRLASWYVDAPEWKSDPTDLNVTEEGN